MTILEVKNLALPGIKILRYGKSSDQRGYFAEIFKASEIPANPDLDFLKGHEFPQINESYSKRGVVKGLHFQWDPPLGKLLRTASGHMVDMILDLRKKSPSRGKIILYNMPDYTGEDFGEWIWLPPGFAHGSFFLEDTKLEYFYTANYNSRAEAGVSPLATDLDWSLCDAGLKSRFDSFLGRDYIISQKDRSALGLNAWLNDPRSDLID